jgi:hypothetical protein
MPEAFSFGEDAFELFTAEARATGAKKNAALIS